MGTKVPSNPIKKRRRFFEENVIIKEIKISRVSVINSRIFFLLFFWRWPILARRETGINQKLKIIRGRLSESIENSQERKLFLVIFGAKRIKAIKKSRDLWVIEINHCLFLGDNQQVKIIPLLRVIRVNIFN